MKMYRDNQGKCINIGDWNFMFNEYEIAQNPLPNDAVESDEDVIIGWDGGFYAKDDPRAVKY